MVVKRAGLLALTMAATDLQKVGKTADMLETLMVERKVGMLVGLMALTVANWVANWDV